MFWKLDDDDRSQYLDWDRKRDILSEFRRLGGEVVVTCGGEPMLDIEDYFLLCSEARRRGCKMFSVVNGTRIHSEKRARKMVTEGPTEITISLDSHLEADHDRMRGVRGSHAVAVRALRLLLDARRQLASSVKIYAMTVVCKSNYRHLDAFYDFVLRDIGADKLKLNILQPSFGLVSKTEDDSFFAAEQVDDPEELAKIILACNEKYQLGINPVWLDQVKMYFRSVANGGHAHRGWLSPAGTEEPICNTYDRNIMVDIYGVARLCFAEDFGGMKLEKTGDLTKFWREFSLPIREKMLGCTRYCGISHSVRRESATIPAGRRLKVT
jgi:molybdenum cofactor biosynthesis enzyme MoaA